MATGPTKRIGRPPGTSKKKEGDQVIRVTLSQRQHAYLCWLRDNSHQGATVNLILHKLIADKLEEMDPSDLRQPKSPATPDGKQGPSQTE